ncbi:MAG: universal stress protein [Hyphomicrobiaceae bacterium]
MYKHLLIATDGTNVGQKAVEQGLKLAKAVNAKVTGVTVTEIWSALDVAGKDGLIKIEKYETAASEAAQSILHAFSAAAKEAGVECETIHVPDSSPCDGIVHTAEHQGCDLIVMASHGRRGINRLLLGSQAQSVISHAKIPVLICR